MNFLEEPIDVTESFLKKLESQGECVVICYNRAEVWQSRSKAIRFYIECVYASEGCERERYTSVFLDLMNGATVCRDGVTEYIMYETEYR